jgi:hypothetical protein
VAVLLLNLYLYQQFLLITQSQLELVALGLELPHRVFHQVLQQLAQLAVA